MAQGPSPVLQELGAAMARYNDLVGYLDIHADLLRPGLKDRAIRPSEDRAHALAAIGLRATPQGRLDPTSYFSCQI